MRKKILNGVLCCLLGVLFFGFTAEPTDIAQDTIERQEEFAETELEITTPEPTETISNEEAYTEPSEGAVEPAETEITEDDNKNIEDISAPTEAVTEPQEPLIDYSPEPDIESIAEEMVRRGNMGRLIIPSFGVDVALFEASLYDINHSQNIVDASDSAAYLSDTVESYGFVIIGDHVYQGFSAIKESIPGSTTMYIDNGVYQTNYICTDIFLGYNGYNNQGGMFDINGNSVVGRNDGGLCLYTCNPDGTITITFWQPT